MAQTGEITVLAELEWESQELLPGGPGTTLVESRSAWVTVSGLENSVHLRPGGRIHASILGCPRLGYRADLVAEVEYGRVDPFWTVGCDFASMNEARQRATAAIATLGIVAMERTGH